MVFRMSGENGEVSVEKCFRMLRSSTVSSSLRGSTIVGSTYNINSNCCARPPIYFTEAKTLQTLKNQNRCLKVQFRTFVGCGRSTIQIASADRNRRRHAAAPTRDIADDQSPISHRRVAMEDL